METVFNSHFTNKDLETQRCQVSGLQAHRTIEVKLALKYSSSRD